jgi:hypothetical protein
MLYEVLGDIWVVRRNPYLQDDLLDNPKRLNALIDALSHRLNEIEKRVTKNLEVPVRQLIEAARLAVRSFSQELFDAKELRIKAKKY